ncbi:MAG: hypothetical protein L0G70_06255, partial [Rubrobacter sp.]|nr:hypothetical protein [Rubrobacter sp.]
RPLHLMVLIIGLGVFAATLAFWIPPLTLATYAALIFLSSRDGSFQSRVLEGRPQRGLPDPETNASPERRARWLPRGQTRERVEAALEVQRKTVRAIEEADDVTREVTAGTIPKLHETAEALVDVARRRETASAEVEKLRSSGSSSVEAEINDLQQEVEKADEELAGMVDRLLTLRAKVVRVSLDSGGPAREEADAMMRDLDGLNRRLDALKETLEPPSDRR